jgi:hypothetical protein
MSARSKGAAGHEYSCRSPDLRDEIRSGRIRDIAGEDACVLKMPGRRRLLLWQRPSWSPGTCLWSVRRCSGVFYLGGRILYRLGLRPWMGSARAGTGLPWCAACCGGCGDASGLDH